jgi:hypothetical protein
MRVVVLSDHPGEQLQQARRRRAAAEDQRQQRYEAALARQHERIAAAVRDRALARAEHRWLAWLRGGLAVRRERRQLPVPPAALARPPDREASLAAGIAGEQQVAAELDRVLGDDWTLIRGYRNRRGEIDHLLLGPRGLAAIEVKNQSVTVDCDGDRWWFVRYDRYGNQVDQGELADRRGRSPSVQLNQPAGQLEEFLRSRGHPVPVQRVVLFIHPRSRLRRCDRPTVRVATSVTEVTALVRDSPVSITADEQAELEHLIRQDHKHHDRHRPGRSRPGR